MSIVKSVKKSIHANRDNLWGAFYAAEHQYGGFMIDHAMEKTELKDYFIVKDCHEYGVHVAMAIHGLHE